MGLHGSGGASARYANTGRRRVKCPYCGRHFFVGSRNRHILLNNGDVFCPYKCPKCEKVSEQIARLDDGVCPYCGYNKYE